MTGDGCQRERAAGNFFRVLRTSVRVLRQTCCPRQVSVLQCTAAAPFRGFRASRERSDRRVARATRVGDCERRWTSGAEMILGLCRWSVEFGVWSESVCGLWDPRLSNRVAGSSSWPDCRILTSGVLACRSCAAPQRVILARQRPIWCVRCYTVRRISYPHVPWPRGAAGCARWWGCGGANRVALFCPIAAQDGKITAARGATAPLR